MMQTGKQWFGYICFDAALMVLSFSYAGAQNTVDEVHVASNVAPVYAGGFRSPSYVNAGLIRKSVELVLVPVTVMDQANRIVTGLQEAIFTCSRTSTRSQSRISGKKTSPSLSVSFWM